MASESVSSYVKLTKDQDAPVEEIRPGELNQPVRVPQMTSLYDTRVSQTVSNRRRREKTSEIASDVIVAYDPDPSPSSQPATQREELNVEEVSDDDTSRSIPGGPEDLSILKSFRTHVAIRIWKRENREVLKCINQATRLAAWPLEAKSPNTRFRTLIKASSLLPLVDCSYRYASKTLISAFVERWQPETNTFHMPFGEMTITLDDIFSILGLPVMGMSISPDDDRATTKPSKMLVNLLGVSLHAANAELDSARGASVRLEWLKGNFCEVSDDDSKEFIECATRAYLLHLLGCTIFVDKTATRVSVEYLALLADLSSVHNYAWGAGALAYLYRQLGLASRFGVRQIAGYLTLLEAWIYEHFPGMRTYPSTNYRPMQHLVHRWTPSRESGTSLSHLQGLREELDRLTPDKVIWDPYTKFRDHHPFPDVSFYTGCLRCMDIVEPYCPERVLRQFGRVQTIPRPPIEPTRASRGAVSNSYIVRYPFYEQMWRGWHNHVLAGDDRSVEARYPSDCVSGYLEWFSRITHPIVQNPAHRSEGSQPIPEVQSSDDRIRHAIQISEPIAKMDRAVAEKNPSLLFRTIERMRATLCGNPSVVDGEEIEPRGVQSQIPTTLSASQLPAATSTGQPCAEGEPRGRIRKLPALASQPLVESEPSESRRRTKAHRKK